MIQLKLSNSQKTYWNQKFITQRKESAIALHCHCKFSCMQNWIDSNEIHLFCKIVNRKKIYEQIGEKYFYKLEKNI